MFFFYLSMSITGLNDIYIASRKKQLNFVADSNLLILEQKMRNPLRSVWLKTRWCKQRLDLIFLTWPYALLKLLQVVSSNCEINKKSPYNFSWVLDSIRFKIGRKADRFNESKALFSLFVDSQSAPDRALRFCSENKWFRELLHQCILTVNKANQNASICSGI